MQSLVEKNCRGFIEALYSRDAVPGGGGAAALAGAQGAALAGMVANLTAGKSNTRPTKKTSSGSWYRLMRCRTAFSP